MLIVICRMILTCGTNRFFKIRNQWQFNSSGIETEREWGKNNKKSYLHI